jgi:polysaccharide pyruvyl transferase WcaK-like protein
MSFVMVPHDYRKHKDSCDIIVSESVWDSLPYEIKEHSMVITEKCRASEIKSICRHLDFVLSGLMHLAIGALGQGTPAVCVSYQGKFEGLFSHFRLSGMTIEPEEALQPGNLVNFLMPLIEKREDIRKHIQAELPRIKQLAQANFE